VSKAEIIHNGKVAELGCALCWHIYGPHEPGPVELHHDRSGGWGKGDYKTLMGLCPEHHRGKTGVHGMGTKAFERHYGITQKELLKWVLDRV
jgi:rubredoxin